MPNNPFEALHNILVIRLDNIGDVIMLSPALRALRMAYSDARITLMASPAGAQTVPLLPWVDQVITWRAVWQNTANDMPVDPQKELALAQLLAEQNFDAAFIFTSFSQSPYPPAHACYLAQIPLRVGQSNEFGGGLLTHWIKSIAHEAQQGQRNLHMLREVQIPVESDALELHVTIEDQRSADALLAALSIGPRDPYIVFAPGASAQARRYDEARFAEVAQALAQESGLPIVLVGSQREIGRFPTLEELAGGVCTGNEVRPRVYSLIGKTSVPEMAALVERAALLIGNNSGAMHMAAAFERPMVILYSGTELLEQWAPRANGVPMRFLYRATACAPCYGSQCSYQMECLDIPAEEVTAAALDILNAGAVNVSASIVQSLRVPLSHSLWR